MIHYVQVDVEGQLVIPSKYRQKSIYFLDMKCAHLMTYIETYIYNIIDRKIDTHTHTHIYIDRNFIPCSLTKRKGTKRIISYQCSSIF